MLLGICQMVKCYVLIYHTSLRPSNVGKYSAMRVSNSIEVGAGGTQIKWHPVKLLPIGGHSFDMEFALNKSHSEPEHPPTHLKLFVESRLMVS